MQKARPILISLLAIADHLGIDLAAPREHNSTISSEIGSPNFPCQKVANAQAPADQKGPKTQALKLNVPFGKKQQNSA